MGNAGYTTHADLGGLEGFGAVTLEPESEPFHAAWEARALAVTLAMGATGSWNIDQSRAARETLPDYRSLSYYQIWIAALERLLAERGLASAEELAAGRSLTSGKPAKPVARVLAASQVVEVLARGTSVARVPTTQARFVVGQRVRTRAEAPPHHTRLPGYLRGRYGRVERVHGVHVFADSHAQGQGEDPQWLYTVAFDEEALWPNRPPHERQHLSVAIDAWEPYLEPMEPVDG
ncbi:MAG: Cobalt-containing nitrile hydratase subunit beta [Burkholderiaceae bacterium]|jgi:nitrile hydratase|nr:MAG: Cobalt-containing nitrile hydratase subunit beta [Burkholderiaceae bacterium]